MATIKTKLEASGVSSYRSQMTSASKAVKTLGAELRQAEAEYKATGDQAAYMAQKSGILQQQIEEQKRAVESAEKGLAAMKKQYGENSTQVMEWRTKLAQAKTQLTTMQTELRSTTAALEAMGDADVEGVADDLKDVTKEAGNAEDAAEDLGEAVGHIAGKLDRDTIINGLESISQKMLGVVRTAGQMGKAIWDASVDAADWADSTNDAAKAADMGVEEYQRVRYAAQFFGLTIDDLVGKQGKLTQAMDESGRIMVGDWAIDTIDRVTGKKRAFSNVMLDIVEGLNLIEDPVQRDQEAMRVFGKSYAEMRGLMDDADSWQSRINEAPVVSKASVESLSDTANEIKTMNSELEVLKMELLATLAPDIKLIAEAVGDLARQLTAFVQSEEGQALLAKLSESIASIITNLTQQDFSGIVEIATKAIEGLTEAFNWISVHQEDLVTAIGAIGAAFMSLNVLALGFKGAQILSSFKSLLGIGTPAATPTAAPATAPAPDMTKASGIIAAGMTPYLTMMYDPIKTEDVRRAWEANPQELLMEPLGLTAYQPDSYQAELINYANMALGRKSGGFLGIGAHTNPALIWGGISRYQQASGLESILGPELYGELMHATPSTASDDLLRRVTGVVSLTDASVFDENVQRMQEVGLSMTEGEVEGLEEGAEDVAAAAEEALGKGPVNRVKTVLQMHSPSRVMAELGMDAALGFASGIDEGAKAAIAAASAMAGAVTAIVGSAMASLAAVGSIGGTGRAAAGSGYYDGSTTINIGTYQQTGGGDMYALAGVVAAAQKHGRQGYGARR